MAKSTRRTKSKFVPRQTKRAASMRTLYGRKPYDKKMRRLSVQVKNLFYNYIKTSIIYFSRANIKSQFHTSRQVIQKPRKKLKRNVINLLMLHLHIDLGGKQKVPFHLQTRPLEQPTSQILGLFCFKHSLIFNSKF